MANSIYFSYKYRFAALAAAVPFLLASCDVDILNKTAQESTGGNGAGMSEYQTVPIP